MTRPGGDVRAIRAYRDGRLNEPACTERLPNVERIVERMTRSFGLERSSCPSPPPALKGIHMVSHGCVFGFGYVPKGKMVRCLAPPAARSLG